MLLIKPQFEAGRPQVSAGRGVIRDPEVWADVLETVSGALVDHRAAMMGVMVSPLTGADGNVEFLAHLRPANGRRAARRSTSLCWRPARPSNTAGPADMAVIGLVTHESRDEAKLLAEDTALWLEAAGCEVRLLTSPGVTSRWGCSPAQLADGLDLAVSLGGDGTMLRTVDLVCGTGVPVLGVNVGHLGYLTEVDPDGLRPP